MLPAIPLLALFAVAVAEPVPVWRMSYFYDKAQSSFDILDIACPSQRFCIAVGLIEDSDGRAHPYSVLTRDGGEHWTAAKLEEPPLSLFFLNETEGWMVTEHGLWNTPDAAGTWKKRRSGTGYLSVAFTDSLHGWVIGRSRLLESTADGGAHWIPVPDIARYANFPADLSFEFIHFDDPLHGAVVGEAAAPPERAPPDWMNPGMARFRTPPRAGVFGGTTADGGRTWALRSIESRRSLIAVAFPSPVRLWLVFAPLSTELNSEVVEDRSDGPGLATVYRMSGARIAGVNVAARGEIVVAAVELSGRLADTPVPGKVRFLAGSSFSGLKEESADYRAVARRITLAPADGQWFAATDTGMILHRR